MTALNTHPTAPALVTRADLAGAGLSSRQIAMLEALAQRYPWTEFLDTDQEYQRLVFLRWRYRTGHLSDG
jgi:hypothetical protein